MRPKKGVATITADAPFEFIGGDVNHSGEIQIAFVIAGGDRLIVPRRKPREHSTLLYPQSDVGLVAGEISEETWLRELFSRSEWIIAGVKRRARLDRLTRH